VIPKETREKYGSSGVSDVAYQEQVTLATDGSLDDLIGSAKAQLQVGMSGHLIDGDLTLADLEIVLVFTDESGTTHPVRLSGDAARRVIEE